MPQPLALADLEQAERLLGITIPTPLKRAYLETDGRYNAAGQWWVMWPLARVIEANLEAWGSSQLPRSVLAFGDDGTGNPFCVLLERSAGDEVLRWSWIDSDSSGDEGTFAEFMAAWTAAPYPCPCCGYRVFSESPGSHEICPLCGWEDDLSQLRFPTMGGPNLPLVECQQSLAALALPTIAEERGVQREPGWRPFDPEHDRFETPVQGHDYGATYASDSADYYYWRGAKR